MIGFSLFFVFFYKKNNNDDFFLANYAKIAAYRASLSKYGMIIIYCELI
jgi:hypothetical protein